MLCRLIFALKIKFQYLIVIKRHFEHTPVYFFSSRGACCRFRAPRRHFIYLLKHIFKMCFNRRTTPDLQCFVTKKARKITPTQYKEQTDTFRYWRAFDKMRQDTVWLLPIPMVYHNDTYSRAGNIYCLNQTAIWTATTQYRDNDTSAKSNLSVKSVARQMAVRAYAGKVKFLWSGLANRRLLLLIQNL